MPANFERTLRLSPGLYCLLSMRRIDEQNGTGNAAKRRQVEDASTRLRTDAEIVRNNQQRARLLHG